MNQIKFSTLFALLAVSSSVFHQSAYAQRSPRESTFDTSCTDISINGAQLSATCIKKDGSNQRTSITIKGVHNRDGKLVQGNFDEESTFNQSCVDVSITGKKISATCSAFDGGSQRSSVTLLGIHNDDGRLTY